MHMTRLALLAVVLLLLSACATFNEPEAAAANGGSGASAQPAPSPSSYRIGPDDQLQVNVWRNEDLSVSVPVRPDGMISVPLIGDVEAGDKTPQEVAAAIEDGLRQYLREPKVTVIVTELRSHEFISRVRVTGAVEAPMSLPYRQGMTVLDAVLEAGGVTEFAAADRARLYRRSGSGTEVMPVRLARILNRGDLDTNVYLRPGDIISVPERLF